MAATTSNGQCFSCLVSPNLPPSTEEILMTHACETLHFDLTPLVKVIDTIFQNAAASSQCTSYATLSDIICNLETFDGMHQALDDVRCISYEMSCNLSRGIEATTMVVLKKLKNYSWNAKVVLAIASIASSIGEVSMIVNHRNTDLIAKSVDLIKGQPLKLDFSELNNLMKAMMDVVNANLAFLMPPICKISKGVPSMKDAMGYFPIATYKIIRVVVQIASILTKREENIDSAMRCLAIEVCNIHTVLQEKLERCRREIAVQCQCHEAHCKSAEKSVRCQCHEGVQCQSLEQSVRCQCHEVVQCQSTEATQCQCHELRCKSREISIQYQCHDGVQCQSREQSVRCQFHEAAQRPSTEAIQGQCHEVVQCQSLEQSVSCQCHKVTQCQSKEAVQCQPLEQSVPCRHKVAQCQSKEAIQCQCHEVQCQSVEQSTRYQCHEAMQCQSAKQNVRCQCHEALCCQSTEAVQCQCHEARCQSAEQSMRCQGHEVVQCQPTEQSIQSQCQEVVKCQSLKQSLRCECDEVVQCLSTKQSVPCLCGEQSIRCQCHEVLRSQCHEEVQCQYEDFWELFPKISIWELIHKIKYNMKIQVPEKLRNKHVLFLVSDLDISIEEIKVLNRLYLKNNQRYEIIWLPIVNVSCYDRTKFSCLKQLMKWGTVNPCKIGPAVIEYIRKEWNFVKAPIAVSLNGEGEVTCQNALPMLWTWGNLAFPFTDTREKDLWSNSNDATGWRLNLLIDENIVPDVLSWSGSFVCLFGGENISWIRDFTERVRIATNATGICSPKLIYVGKNKSKGLTRNELGPGIYVLECEYRWQFWTKLESILYTKFRQGKSSKTDCVMREALKVLGYGGNCGTWAMFSMGSASMMTTNGEMALTIMSKYREWKMNKIYTGPCFFEALRNYYFMIQSKNVCRHGCIDVHLPVLGQIPGIAICPECCKEMEMSYNYRCCL